MLDALQKIESLNAEIRLLEAQQGDGWRGRIVVLLERKIEIERELNLTEAAVYGH